MAESTRKKSAKGKGHPAGRDARTTESGDPKAGAPHAAQPDLCLASAGSDASPTLAPGGDAPVLVGIGASAGGLEALRTFVANLPARSRFAYVIAQHLSPTHQSMLVPLISRETQLPVHEVKDGHAPEANVVYITPAGSNIRISQGRFRLAEATTPGVPKPSIDGFFVSLAEDQGEATIAIVLSGTGSDGARGMRAVRAVGGMTFAQDEQSAKYSGMPRAAVDSGAVDFVLAPAEIGKRLASIAALPPGQELPPLEADAYSTYDQIFSLVRGQTGVDFRLYKESTVGRRIRRRMAATESTSLEAYCALLGQHPEEVERLSQEILISVTSFFREHEAFESLRGAVEAIVERKLDNEDVRVWVAGCATGEEAYSVTILFFEALARARRKIKLQIFATDVDTVALAKARRGVFAREDLVTLSEERARTYFSEAGEFVQVSKSLREAILFSTHNLVSDPPFLRLDLITCRNVLIYFKPEVQARLLRVFHGALRPAGQLFLGRSETTFQQDQLFTADDERARIYARNDVAPMTGARLRDFGDSPRLPERSPARPRTALNERVLQAILGHFLPGAVVVDEALNLKHVYGDVSAFMTIQPGEPNLNLYALALPTLRVEIRSMVMKAQRAPASPLAHVVKSGARGEFTRIGVVALPVEAGETRAFLVTLQRKESTGRRRTKAVGADGPDGERQQRELEEQLAATREHLQTVIEELETSNEELQSLNEELSSANEELQSTNEEMETSNEELQSTNEELTTVNEELETKTHELIRLNTDLKNVKDSLEYALIVVDEYLRVTLFNPHASSLFDLTPASIGQNLFSLPAKFDIDELRPQLEAVIQTGQGLERQFIGPRCYLLHAHPYLDENLHRRGAVLTFIDNTEFKNTEARLIDSGKQVEASERFARSTIDALSDHICVIDEVGNIVAVNRAWCDFADNNGGVPLGTGMNANYLEVCRRAVERGDAPARRFLDGMLAVIAGTTNQFSIEYPCHAPGSERWFEARVTAFPGDGPRYIVVAHENITERRGREQQMNLQTRALDSSINGIVIADATEDGYPLVYVNRAFEQISGYVRDEVLGRDCRFLQGDDRAQPGLARVRSALRDGREERVLLRNYRKDGTLFWNELSLYPISDEDGAPRYYVGVQRDMTSLVASEEALRSSRERERLALAFAGVGMFSWDVSGGQINASDIMLRLLGIPGAGSSIDQAAYRTLIHEEDRPIFDDAVKLCLAGHESLDIEYRVLWPDGSIHWLHTKGDVENTPAGLPQRLLCLSQDVTVRKESDERVRFIAHHDALTGLPNRTLLRDRLQQALNAARRHKAKVAVLFIDLDHFKHVNDSLGHHIGDLLLQSVSNRLRGLMRDSDTLCRHSGDEYVVVLPEVHDSGEAAHVAEKIVEALSLPHQIGKHELVVTPSLGISLYPDDGDKIDALIRNADAAMYHAKGSGRRNFQFFMPEMNRREHDRLTISTDLRHALERGELQVHYQPEISVSDGRIVGLEALVRWMHPQRGMIYPNTFIPVAEDSELVLLVGEWVLREACRQARKWQADGLRLPAIAVNFSAMQFRQRNIMAKISQPLHDAELDPSLLEIELTESAIMHNVDGAADTLANLHKLGIRLAIDDFGTGYSSLQHLRRFPIDKLKIDQSFINDLPGDKNSASIVCAMIMLGQSLKLDVVAEGVETDAQLAFLREQNCLAYQGHFCAQAMDADAFAKFARKHGAGAPAARKRMQ